jgi:hypothetical protein
MPPGRRRTRAPSSHARCSWFTFVHCQQVNIDLTQSLNLDAYSVLSAVVNAFKLMAAGLLTTL